MEVEVHVEFALVLADSEAPAAAVGEAGESVEVAVLAGIECSAWEAWELGLLPLLRRLNADLVEAGLAEVALVRLVAQTVGSVKFAHTMFDTQLAGSAGIGRRVAELLRFDSNLAEAVHTELVHFVPDSALGHVSVAVLAAADPAVLVRTVADSSSPGSAEPDRTVVVLHGVDLVFVHVEWKGQKPAAAVAHTAAENSALAQVVGQMVADQEGALAMIA